MGISTGVAGNHGPESGYYAMKKEGIKISFRVQARTFQAGGDSTMPHVRKPG